MAAMAFTVTLCAVAASAQGASPPPAPVRATLATATAPSLSSPYGEVSRFGGFDATGSTPGKFVLPVGFAVDPSDPSTADHNAVYVLDRTYSKVSKGELRYRLQKLSSKGEVLGSVTLPLEKYTDTEEFSDAHPLISLAVDSAKKRVYALVEGTVDAGGGNFVPIAQRLIAWSTEPNAGKELVRAPGYPEDTLTKASLVAGEGALEPSTEPSKVLYAPEGLAIASNHDVAIEAQQGVASGAAGGPTVLQRVATEGEHSGQLDGTWVANSTIAPNGEQAGGIFTTSEGFGIDLYQELGAISRLATVNTNLTSASLLAPDTTAGKNPDQAPSIDNSSTPNRNHNNGGQTGASDLGVYTAASPTTQVSGGAFNGLYVARYGQGAAGVSLPRPDIQAEVAPWDVGGKIDEFWEQGDSTTKGVAKMGLRLFEADGHIVTTIGGAPQGEPCSLDTAALSVAAGADGALFALTQPNEENEDNDDEVVEFAPGGSGACPVPAGQIEVDGTEVKSAGGVTPTVTVDQKAPVSFDASSLDLAGETPYAFEWNFTGETTGPNAGYTLTSKMEGAEYKWPTPLAKMTYERAGTYQASVRVTGDYGTVVTVPVTVRVITSEPAIAEFAVPTAATAGQAVSFDASASKATPGSAIEDYHWEFGDGSEQDTHSPQVSHEYASAGQYMVKLRITDEVGETATVEHLVEVRAATVVPPPPPPPPAAGGGGVSPGSGGGAPPAKAAGTPKLTSQERLALALKACRKGAKKKHRASCEKQAKKRYGAKTRKHKK